jgi:Zn-dependent membrane protease YugP
MFYFDPLYFAFLLPGVFLALFAQWRVKSTYAKMAQIPAQNRLTGAEVARRLLDSQGLYNVRIERVPGELTDHYDPRAKVMRLSDGVYGNFSVAAQGIVAHETGHAVQDKENYAYLKLRGAIVPAVNIGSNFGWILLFMGILTGAIGLAWLGVALFSLGTVFALITLPVEFDASNRAMKLLAANGLVSRAEYGEAKSVLDAAALTYLAAAAGAILQLLYYILLLSGMSGRRD